MCGKEMCWIGFEEPPETETWYWADGARTAYRNWDEQYKQPGNNKATDETVAIMHSRRVNSYIGTWFDTREEWGSSAAPFAACERPKQGPWVCGSATSICMRRGTKKVTIDVDLTPRGKRGSGVGRGR